MLAFQGALAESAVSDGSPKILIVGEATVGRPSSFAASRALRVSWTGFPAGSPRRARLNPLSPTGRSSRTSWSPPPDTSKQPQPHSAIYGQQDLG
jgi:hypothetical protein